MNLQALVIKGVTFTRVSELWYNIGFGDLDSESGKTIDNSITNNGDSHIVLATVAEIIRDFIFRKRGIVVVVAVGFDEARNRLYRMGINKHWIAIRADFEVLGWFNDDWENFSKGKNMKPFSFNIENCKFGYGKCEKEKENGKEAICGDCESQSKKLCK